jgi:multiple sugar transport system ATP-binding protein
MRKGELQQVAPPQELYDEPVNMFVAGFIGSPAMNMLEAAIERRGNGIRAVVGDTPLELDEATLARCPRLTSYDGSKVVLGIRPEDLEDATLEAAADQARLTGTVILREALGSEVLVHFTTDARPALSVEIRELAEDVGDDRALEQFSAGRRPVDATVVGRFSPRTRVAQGDLIEVAIDQRALHFFDPASGAAISGSTR